MGASTRAPNPQRSSRAGEPGALLGSACRRVTAPRPPPRRMECGHSRAHPPTLRVPGNPRRYATVARGALADPALLHAQIVLLHELVLTQLVGATPLELDLAVHDDVAAVGDLGGLVEVLLGHQHGETPLVLHLLDLGDHPGDEDRGQTDRGLLP